VFHKTTSVKGAIWDMALV